MESPRVFHQVLIKTFYEDGTRENKYPESVTISLEYDTHGLTCFIKSGKFLFIFLSYAVNQI